MKSFDGLLDLPSGRTRVRVHGDGPPLLWCHGVFFPIDVDDQSTLGGILRDGAAGNFAVIRLDARGHGRSVEGADHLAHRWDRMALDIVALADALAIDRFVAGGISMGAAVMLHAALHIPERIAAMLLFALPTAWETRPAEKVRYLELLELGSSEALGDHVQRDFDVLFPDQPLPPALAAMVAGLRASSWTALERVIRGASESDMPSREDLARLEIPVLLRPWPNDSGHPLSTAESLAATLCQASCSLLESFDDEAGIRRAFEELRKLCADVPIR